MKKWISLIGGVATEVEAVIELQSGDPAGAEVVTVVTVRTESQFAHHDETAGIVRSVVIAESETVIAEEILEIEMTDAADQAETGMTVETAHALEIVTEGEASAHAVEAAAATEETVTVPVQPVLLTEMGMPLRPGSNWKSRSEKKKQKHTSLLRKRRGRKACRFLAGRIGGMSLLHHDVETMIALRALRLCVSGSLLEIGIEIVSAPLGREVDLAPRLDAEVESRDLRALSTLTAMSPVHRLVDLALLGVQLASVNAAEIEIETVTVTEIVTVTVTETETETETGIGIGIGIRIETVDMLAMRRSLGVRAAREAAAGDEIGVETAIVRRREVEVVVRM